MRFLSLHIENYGTIADRKLIFPPTGKLCVIYGPNEAGKSTTLSAFTDFLYGVPERSEKVGIFGKNLISLRAEILAKSGSRLSLQRRKARKSALTDEAGNDASQALASLLGSTSQERFEAFYGLNNMHLRQGGLKLLEENGEIGTLILEAGGGLRNFAPRLKAIKEESETLFAPHKANARAFYQKLDRFNEYNDRIKENLLSVEAYHAAENELLAAEKNHAHYEEQRAATRREEQKLALLARILPHVETLKSIETALHNFDDLPQALPQSPEALKALLVERAVLDAQCSEYKSQLMALQEAARSLTPSHALLEIADDIRAFDAKAHEISKARIDQQRIIADIASEQEDAARLMLQISTSTNTEGQPSIAPSAKLLHRISDAFPEAIEFATELNGLERSVEQMSHKISSLQEALATSEENGFHRPCPYSVDGLSQLPALEKTLHAKRQTLGENADQIGYFLKSLDFNTEAEFHAFLFPPREFLEQKREEHRLLFEKALRIDEELNALQQKHAQCIQEKSILEKNWARSGQPLPSHEAIARLRQIRDTHFTEIEDAYTDENFSKLRAKEEVQRRSEVENFMRAQRNADELVDRKAFEAERIAKFEALEATILQLATDIRHCEARSLAQTKSLKAAKANWCAQFGAFTEKYGQDFDRAKAILLTAEKLDAAAVALAQQNTSIEQQEHELQIGIETLNAVEAFLSFEATNSKQNAQPKHAQAAIFKPPLSQRISTAKMQLNHYLAQHTIWQENQRDLLHARSSQKEAQSQRDKLRLILEKDAAFWQDARRNIGLPDDTPLNRLGPLAQRYLQLDHAQQKISSLNARINGMQREETIFHTALAGIFARIQEQMPFDILDAHKALASMLARHQIIADQFQKNALEQAEIHEKLTRVSSQLLESTEQCEIWQSALHLSFDALQEAVARLITREELRLQRQSLQNTILTAGDGRDLEALLSLAGAHDSAALHGLQLNNKLAILDAEKAMYAAHDRRQAAKTKLESFQGASQINALMAQRENARTEMQNIVRRYLELGFTYDLLSDAAEKLRKDTQDPLLKRAEQHFHTLTNGRFSGFSIDVDEKDKPVIEARRHNDAHGATGASYVKIDHLSEGTRDQLFLSFRLAAIERDCEIAEPLPFIADDILNSFDETRGLSGLKTLAELAKTTQTIIFTHHSHIKEAALSLGSDVEVIDLQ